MVASIGSHFENIKLQYLKKYETDFHAVCIKMCSFPTLLDKIYIYFCVPFPLSRAITVRLLSKSQDRFSLVYMTMCNQGFH